MTSATGSAGAIDARLVELAKQLVDRLAPRQEPQLPQRRIELRFCVLGNTLGNFGRVAGSGQLLLAVELEAKTNKLKFVNGLPKAASLITLFYSDGTDEDISVPANDPLVRSSNVVAIEVVANDGALLAFGVVRQV